MSALRAIPIPDEPPSPHTYTAKAYAAQSPTRPPDRYQQVLLTRKIHCLDHIVRAGASGNEGRPSIDSDVEDFACAVIFRVAGDDKLTTKMGLQLLDCRRG
jgi:hypothetical protein